MIMEIRKQREFSSKVAAGLNLSKITYWDFLLIYPPWRRIPSPFSFSPFSLIPVIVFLDFLLFC